MLGAISIWALYVLAIAVCALQARAFPYVIALGVAVNVIEWILAYRSNLVERGGDWDGGAELAAFTGVLALLLFGLWVGAALLGRAIGRALQRRDRRHGRLPG